MKLPERELACRVDVHVLGAPNNDPSRGALKWPERTELYPIGHQQTFFYLQDIVLDRILHSAEIFFLSEGKTFSNTSTGIVTHVQLSYVRQFHYAVSISFTRSKYL